MQNDWVYSDEVKDHFINPKNVLKDENPDDYDGKGLEGNIKCGDEMLVLIKVNKDDQLITDCKWKTYGCASAIASMSVLSEMVKGMKLEDAYKIIPGDITKSLGGLPDNKIHCSVLGDKALRESIDNYYSRNGMANKVKNKEAKVVCKCLHITDADLKEAIKEGASTYYELQEKTKCGTVCGECEEEIKHILAEEIHH